MAYSEKDLFLVLTVVCLLVVIYLITSLWRSAGKAKPEIQIKPKRVERIRRVEAPAAAAVLPKVPKPEPVKETPRLPQALALVNGEGKLIATARATDVDNLVTVAPARVTLPEASLQVLHQYFKLDHTHGVIAHRMGETPDMHARSMTVYDQKGGVLIQTVPVDFSVASWPVPQSVDAQRTLYEEVCGLYRREFLERMTWQTQAFLLRLERCSPQELLQVPLHPAIRRPLMLLLTQKLLESGNYWERCAILNCIERHLEETSFENQFDGKNLNQRIKLHSFALTQTSTEYIFIRADGADRVLSL
ncbi:MAG: hypothetical protein J6V64_05325 [Burkholderiaceae bacterium]|nr:hypothetical protein [Burkholderiaceae bacterium]